MNYIVETVWNIEDYTDVVAWWILIEFSSEKLAYPVN